jgi:hypothetical protein
VPQLRGGRLPERDDLLEVRGDPDRERLETPALVVEVSLTAALRHGAGEPYRAKVQAASWLLVASKISKRVVCAAATFGAE